MNSRVVSVISAVKSLADACAPVKRCYKIRYFKRVPFEGQPGMFKSEWTTEYRDAYNREEAAQLVNPKLRPGYNCYVTVYSAIGADDDSV